MTVTFSVSGHLIRRVFFFFFQAEDGIRDVAVTGVQTCALPIFRKCHPHCFPGLDAGKTMWMALAKSASELGVLFQPLSRSEERRVGKECRSRWSPYH